MPMDDELILVLDEVDLLVAELRELRERGPHFRIYHRFHKPGTICAPGEEIAAICLVHRGREYPLRLSLSLRILFDYLARHNRFPQSASQIEAGIRADPFYARHSMNSGVGRSTRSIPRSFVRVYIERLIIAITQVISESNFPANPQTVLVKKVSVINECGLQLNAWTEWVHCGGLHKVEPKEHAQISARRLMSPSNCVCVHERN